MSDPYPPPTTALVTPGLRGRTVAVLGGRGMLGTDVVRALGTAGAAPRVLDLPEFDIRSARHLEAALAGADAVVNCAAYTNVDGAEKEPQLAQAVNGDAVGALGERAAALGCHVLHIGTDFVFDGELDRPYRETDEPRPLSVYGQTKLAGERRLAASGAAAVVLRVQWTYGHAGVHFVRKLLERARTAAEVRMVDDQFGAPTWTRDVAAVIVALLARHTVGLFHYAAAGYASRLEIARFVLDEMHLGCRLASCRTADFPAPARRPLNSRFDCSHLERELGLARPPWPESLREFLHTEPPAGTPPTAGGPP